MYSTESVISLDTYFQWKSYAGLNVLNQFLAVQSQCSFQSNKKKTPTEKRYPGRWRTLYKGYENSLFWYLNVSISTSRNFAKIHWNFRGFFTCRLGISVSVADSELVSNQHLGASIDDVRKFFGFLTPSPLVTVTNQLILSLLSAFWGPSSPTRCKRHI